MSVTDRSVLASLQRRVLEPDDLGVTWPSGLWTRVEVVGYLNQRQHRFLRDTLLLGAHTQLDTIPNISRQALPDDWIATIRVGWKDAVTGRLIGLPRGETFEADHGLPDWPRTLGTPVEFSEIESPNLEIALIPAPVDAGIIDLLYVGLAGVLGADPTADELFTVPDVFVPALLYGVLADMLGKVGRAHDPERATYCEGRFREGVEVARFLLSGGI